MAKLPKLTGKELGKIIEKIGFVFDHQTGSHMILRHKEEPHRRLTVPNHKELAKGTLRAIIRQAGLTKEELERMTKQAKGFEEKELSRCLNLFLEAENKMKFSPIQQLPLELAIIEATGQLAINN